MARMQIMKNRFKLKFETGGNAAAERRKFFAKYRAKLATGKFAEKSADNCAVSVRSFPPARKGYDPELLFVECSRCGAPILWESGKATKLLDKAGIDPLELDASCMLITDACPSCSRQKEYTVKIFRLSGDDNTDFPPKMGHA